MPVTRVGWNGQELTVEEALDGFRNGTVNWPFPYAFVKTAIETNKVRTFVSPSQIKSCPRQFVLKQWEDYTLQLEDTEASIKGTGYHEVMQQALKDEPGFIIEHRFSRTAAVPIRTPDNYLELYPLKLTGQPDVVDLSTGTIDDYKTTGGYIRRDFSGYDGHKIQLHIYGWLVRAEYPGVTTGRLYYIGQKQRAKIEFPLWTDVQVESYIAEAAVEYVRWMKDPEYLPPIPTDEDMLRFCKTCPVRVACDAYDQEG